MSTRLAVLVLLLAPGCSGGMSGEAAQPTPPDASEIAGTDAAAAPGLDAGVDGGAPAGADAGADAGTPLPSCPCWLTDGDYCGQVVLDHGASSGCQVAQAVGNAKNLMTCKSGGWSVKQVCAAGCTFRPGLDDVCALPNGYHLPWANGVTHTCTQGHNQGSHTGLGVWAWDFGLPPYTPVSAARAGTVSIVQFYGQGDACWNGVPVACGSCTSQTDGATDCTNRGNRVVVNHGDGTQALYLHLWGIDVTVGQAVSQGQVIGKSGNSGCSCGAHLHYMVSSYSSSNYYMQSISTSFIEAGDPGTGTAVTSQNP